MLNGGNVPAIELAKLGAGFLNDFFLTSAATLTEFKVIEPLPQFVEPQEDAAILPEQLPAEPADHDEEQPCCCEKRNVEGVMD